MRKSLDSHYIEEVVDYVNEGAESSNHQIRPSLSDFKIDKGTTGVYFLTAKFRPGEKDHYYSFVKAILELGEQVEGNIYSVEFVFPFPKRNIAIAEVDEELGELGDITDKFDSTNFNWIFGEYHGFDKVFNKGALIPSLVITEEGLTTGGSSIPNMVGYFSLSVNYKNGVPFVNETALKWEEI